MTVCKRGQNQRSVCKMWFTDEVDNSSHLFQRCLMLNLCHPCFKKSVFWSRISSKFIKENVFCLFSGD